MNNTFGLSNIVTITQNNSNNFSAEEIVRICKRDSNPKRDFLFVNTVQGKYLHVNPQKTFSLFEELAKQIQESILSTETVTIIGFAETATALGHYIASRLKKHIYYIQTTREKLPDSTPLLTFSEEHSHAPTHYLYGNLTKLKKSSRIIFIDDEISTGNTVLNFIKELSKLGITPKYEVGSLLNFQNEYWQTKFAQNGIGTYCIVKGEITSLDAKVNAIPCADEYISNSIMDLPEPFVVKQELTNFKKERTLEEPIPFEKFSEKIFSVVKKELKGNLPNKGENVLVLGTEEYMYVPMILANSFNKQISAQTEFHATARSPIAPSDSSEYAINQRYPITSPYDLYRKTYVYNLKKYDKVYIVTDTLPTSEFFNDIQVALKKAGNDLKNIFFVIMM